MTPEELEELALFIEGELSLGPVTSDEDDYWVAGGLYAAKLVREYQYTCKGPCFLKGQFDCGCKHNKR